MKRTLLPLTLLLLALTALPAFAAGSAAPYVEAKIGGNYTQIDNIRNTSPVAAPAPASKSSVDGLTGVVGAAVGLNFKGMGLPVRAEAEYAYHSQLSYDAAPTFVGAAIPTSLKSDADSQTLFFNAYYDFETGTAFTPYVGGGLGMAWNHTEATGTVIATGASQDYRKTTDNFAWNLSAGCGYKLTDNWALNAGYRYLDLGKIAWGDGASSLASKNMTAHEVTMGLRYQF
ncbi:MAG: TonB-dependent receptor [Humidesulfovibrio sp.]|uniref:outer membrane protein n=1 Tax=Humidesulfovibrio sp. TaxID=2910988 RepID=UPI002735A854|nr:outer membrane beta-barrel protein [Humidesulfovibrio sp.]MDP2846934.1 TonB-dependent receptor [Humidesulfovibrio sp.]